MIQAPQMKGMEGGKKGVKGQADKGMRGGKGNGEEDSTTGAGEVNQCGLKSIKGLKSVKGKGKENSSGRWWCYYAWHKVLKCEQWATRT